MIIYLDILFLKECLMNYLIVFITSKITKSSIKRLGGVVAVIIASLYTVICLINYKYASAIYRVICVLITVMMSLKNYSFKELVRNLITYYFVTFFIGGVCFYTNNQMTKTSLYIVSILIILFTLIDEYKKKIKLSNYIVDVVINSSKGNVKLQALIDTGHSLKTIDKKDVIILSSQFYEKIKSNTNKKSIVEYSTIQNNYVQVIGECIESMCVKYNKEIYNHKSIVCIKSNTSFKNYDAIISTDFLNSERKETRMEILFLIKEKTKKLFTKFLTFMGFIDKNEIYYIGGAEVLPPPLLPEEEKQILDKISTDGESAKKILIERNLRLVVYIAKKFENTPVLLEDLISIGTIGLVKAINTYNPTKNIKLATYASRCIENEILMHLRRTNKLKNEVSIDEPLNTDGDGNELLLSDIIGTEEDVIFKGIEQAVDNQLIKEAITKLNKREKIIMELRFGFISGKEKTQKEVADMLGISQSYISRLEKKIIAKMKKEMMAKI